MTPDLSTSSRSAPQPERFPVKIWLIAFAGWTFDFYDLVLFSFLLIPLGDELRLGAAQQAWLLGVALGASGLGGILFGYLSDVYGRRRVMMWTICLYSLGTALTVPTLEGQARVKVPPGSSTGQLIRLRRQGYPAADGSRGDMFAEVRIEIPKSLSAEERTLMQKLSQVSRFSPRAVHSR